MTRKLTYVCTQSGLVLVTDANVLCKPELRPFHTPADPMRSRQLRILLGQCLGAGAYQLCHTIRQGQEYPICYPKHGP